MLERAVFFDKDGTLINNIPYNVDPDNVTFSSGADKALSILNSLNSEFQFHVVTNQAGVALGYFQEEELVPLKEKMSEMFRELGVSLKDFHYCPHHPEGKIKEFSIVCDCRKPAPKMIMKAAEKYNLDLSHSWMIGDILDDIESGKRAGCKTILLDNGNETEWKLNEWREPDFKVKNLEEAAKIIAGII
jgi:D-glycero-D-manno-heptose 1,7-bisphosphate phosphatase